MKKYLLVIFLISLLISGCSNKLNYKDMLNLNLPFFNDYKLDKTLPKPIITSATPSMREVSLNWRYDNKRIISGYRIFRYSNSDKKYVLIKVIYDPYITNYVDKNLLPNMVYSYKIAAFTNKKTTSSLSAPVSVKTIYNLLPIKSLKASRGLVRQIKLNWSLYPQYNLIKYYKVLRSSDKKYWEVVGIINKRLQTQYIDKSVKDGDGYFYKIYGVTFEDVKTPYSNIAFGNTKPRPKMINDVIVSRNLPRKIQITWLDPNIDDKSRTITHYNIYYSFYKDKIYLKKASIPSSQKVYIDYIKEDGKEVCYKVSAVDSDGLESPLPPKGTCSSTKASSAAPKIIEYKIVDGRVVIRWEPMSRDIVSYVVKKRYFDKLIIPKTIKYTNIKTTTFVDKDIKLNKTYRYQVIGIDKDNIPTKPSLEVSIKVK